MLKLMYLWPVLFISLLPTNLCKPTNTRNLDFTDVCSTFGNINIHKTEYCSTFNDTCSIIFQSKKVCARLELNCGYGEDKCVLHDCREYTGKVQELEGPKSQMEGYVDRTDSCDNAASNKINGTNYCGRFELCCLNSFEQLERGNGNVCRSDGKRCEANPDDEQKGSGTCEFFKCTEKEQNAFNHPVVPFDWLTIRTTPVAETDIDETKYAAYQAIYIAYNKTYCEAFYKACQFLVQWDSEEQERNYKIKEVFCVPQQTGGPAKGACILTEE